VTLAEAWQGDFQWRDVPIRGDIYNEYICWDQASMLAQLGVLDPTGLPIAGIETAKKLKGEPIPTNTLMPTWKQR